MNSATRAKLVSVAREAFARSGFAGIAMEDLVAQAGMTRGALYHQFGGKEGLLKAVAAEIDKEIMSRLLEQTRHIDDPWENFRAGCLGYLAMALEPEIQRIMLKDAPAVLGNEDREMHGQCLPALAIKLELAMGDGLIRRANSVALARLLGGALSHAALWIGNDPHPKTRFADTVEAFNMLLDGLELERSTRKRSIAKPGSRAEVGGQLAAFPHK